MWSQGMRPAKTAFANGRNRSIVHDREGVPAVSASDGTRLTDADSGEKPPVRPVPARFGS